ncbi:MAG: prepilin-type N-terminal cleavage/methylation domain-containing protein [Holophagaceae bacterium]|nr:prepilin-type N-terminal cleavage/methylation domain-containing protein [Holophagaceae bacterium]
MQRSAFYSANGFRSPAFFRQAAFSLMELLVVLVIVAILAVGSAFMIGSNKSGAVRSLMDELEGIVSNAHQAAVATGKDIALVTWGAWDTDNPMRIAFGDASLNEGAGADTNFITVGERVLEGNPPSLASPALTDTLAFPVPAQQTVTVPFQYTPRTDAILKRARIVAVGDGGWDAAIGTNSKIEEVAPFSADPSWASVLDEGNNFFRASGGLSHVYISGSTKRFARTVYIKIVSTSTSGGVLASGPMGLLVMQANGASVYRFYNPGADSGGQWRRI